MLVPEIADLVESSVLTEAEEIRSKAVPTVQQRENAASPSLSDMDVEQEEKREVPWRLIPVEGNDEKGFGLCEFFLSMISFALVFET